MLALADLLKSRSIDNTICHGGGGAVGQNLGAQYPNKINLQKWTNLGAKFELNRTPRYKKGQILT